MLSNSLHSSIKGHITRGLTENSLKRDFGSSTDVMSFAIIPIIGVVIFISTGPFDAYAGNTSALSIKETIDEVVTGTLDGMMNDTIDTLIQDTSNPVLSQGSNTNQSNFPSILDMSQSPSQDKSFVTNSSNRFFNQNLSDTRAVVANYNNATDAKANFNNSSFSNQTQDTFIDSHSDKVDDNRQNYSSATSVNNNNKSYTSDEAKPVNYLEDLFDKLVQLLFKRS
jgi:hypothetical protein